MEGEREGGHERVSLKMKKRTCKLSVSKNGEELPMRERNGVVLLIRLKLSKG